jgi:quercetin dioxygenase-like cupin family protein
MSHLTSAFRTAALSAFLAAPSVGQDMTPVPVDPIPPISRTVLQTVDIADSGLASTLVLVDIAPNVTVGRHTHPGNVSAYVVYGSIEVEVDGGAKRRFEAGQSFTVPGNTVHDERTGAAGARVVASFVVPSGMPLSTPVN